MEGALTDPTVQRFINAETQKQRFQKLVHNLTEQCWETCLAGAPGSIMTRKTEQCFENCVDRFLDTSNFVVNRLEKEGEATIRHEQKSGMSSSDFNWN